MNSYVCTMKNYSSDQRSNINSYKSKNSQSILQTHSIVLIKIMDTNGRTGKKFTSK